MTMKPILCSLSAASLSVWISLAPPAAADTGLFPVIASSQPSISTIISVINASDATFNAPYLTYVYRYKSAFKADTETPNTDGTCDAARLTRPSGNGDVVSFDVSGNIGNGGALFGDANVYGGGFRLGVKGSQRGYLLVTNSDSAGNSVDVNDDLAIGGEFLNLDIDRGAGWGGKVVNDIDREHYNFINAAHYSGGVYSALPNNGRSYRRFTFFPPIDWGTKFFVTPIGNAMDTDNLTTSISLTSVYDRNGIAWTFVPLPVAVTCTGAVDLGALMDATTWAAIENIGGWGILGVTSDAVVYKLEFSKNPLYATDGGAVNNGFLLSDYERP